MASAGEFIIRFADDGIAAEAVKQLQQNAYAQGVKDALARMLEIDDQAYGLEGWADVVATELGAA